MRNLITLEDNKYSFVRVNIENTDGTQKFKFTQDGTEKGNVYITFEEQKSHCVSEEETDLYTPEEAYRLLHTLLAYRWKVTLQKAF
jgi:hypothetical protein